jgi:hypothetical protein
MWCLWHAYRALSLVVALLLLLAAALLVTVGPA